MIHNSDSTQIERWVGKASVLMYSKGQITFSKTATRQLKLTPYKDRIEFYQDDKGGKKWKFRITKKLNGFLVKAISNGAIAVLYAKPVVVKIKEALGATDCEALSFTIDTKPDKEGWFTISTKDIKKK